MNIDGISGSTTEGRAGLAHVPVLLAETLEHLAIKPGKVYVDVTAGFGGHLVKIREEIISKGGSNSDLIGMDRDPRALDVLKEKTGNSIKLAHANYCDIRSTLAAYGINTISGGILADLGVSSMQLDDPERGFSFLRDGPLDMRMDTSQRVTAAQLINNLSERELADIIFQFGEERHSRQIARSIVKARPLATTGQLAEIVCRSLPRPKKRGTARDASHPATRTFQALRIAVNEELSSLKLFLQESIDLLSPGGRLVVITFHSLEDRLVKQIFRNAASECVCPPRQPVCNCDKKRELLIITRRPVIAAEKEVLANVRSRSAKLRAGEKLGFPIG